MKRHSAQAEHLGRFKNYGPYMGLFFTIHICLLPLPLELRTGEEEKGENKKKKGNEDEEDISFCFCSPSQPTVGGKIESASQRKRHHLKVYDSSKQNCPPSRATNVLCIAANIRKLLNRQI